MKNPIEPSPYRDERTGRVYQSPRRVPAPVRPEETRRPAR